MKKITRWITVLSIVAGIWMGIHALLVPLAGLALGLLLAAPLLVTLVMSNMLVGTTTQTILLVSTVGYLTNLLYQLYFSSNREDPSPLFHSIPVMVVLWFAAGLLSLTRDEIERRHDRNRPEPGP